MFTNVILGVRYEYIKYPQKNILQSCEFDPDTSKKDKKWKYN